MKLKGKAWIFGDDINTDDIISAKYLVTTAPQELGKHCLEVADETFARKVGKGDIIVAGKNFGCGSSREHAPLAIKGCGVSCVVARSFACIFYRNAINIGLPIVECGEVAGIKQADLLDVDLEEGWLVNLTQKKRYKTQPFPPFLQDLINQGGLMSFVKNRYAR